MSPEAPLISVVTPFYNTEAYLAECIESVLQQTYARFEYVLVDNQSSDRSAAIAASYARRDTRIRLLRADRFRSQIANYNYAVEQLSSESRYIKFAQADDWLYPRCLSEMVALAETAPRLAVVSSYDLRGNQVYGSGLWPGQQVLSGREACRLYFLKWLFLFGSPTTVLYRADAVRSRRPFLDEAALHPDTEALFDILAASDFGFVHQVLSFIRTQEDSVTGQRRALSDAALDRLIIVKKYGRRFLTTAEYEECLQRSLDWYYDDLGRRWLAGFGGRRRDDFWAFHRRGLATIGESISRPALRRAAMRLVARKLFAPGQFVRGAQGPRADGV